MEDLVHHHGEPEGGLYTLGTVVSDNAPPPDDRPTTVEKEVGEEDEREPPLRQACKGEHWDEAGGIFATVSPERAVPKRAQGLIHSLELGLDEVVAHKVREDKELE